MKTLFESVVDVNESLRNQRLSVLHHIVLGLSKIDLEQQLLLTTSEIESRCSLGRTPLLWATTIGDLRAVKVLLKFGADVRSLDNNGRTVFHQTVNAQKDGENNEILSLLLRETVSGKPSGCGNVTLARKSALDHRGINDSGKYLIKNLLDHQDIDGCTPLTVAALHHKSSIQARLLLDFGASPQIISEKTRSPPLLVACIQRWAYRGTNHSILKLLLESPLTRMDVLDLDRWGLLHHAGGCADFEARIYWWTMDSAVSTAKP